MPRRPSFPRGKRRRPARQSHYPYWGCLFTVVLIFAAVYAAIVVALASR